MILRPVAGVLYAELFAPGNEAFETIPSVPGPVIAAVKPAPVRVEVDEDFKVTEITAFCDPAVFATEIPATSAVEESVRTVEIYELEY